MQPIHINFCLDFGFSRDERRDTKHTAPEYEEKKSYTKKRQ